VFCGASSGEKFTSPEAEKTLATKQADMTKALADSFAFCDQALNQLDDTKLGEPVTITFGANSRIVARGGMALGHALDLADHYSQLANYMR
jgi:hypothetical protein